MKKNILFYILLGLCIFTNCSSNEKKIKSVLEQVDLSMIPGLSRNVLFYTRGNLFSRTYYIKFDSTKKDLDIWINNNSGLKEIDPIYYTDMFQLLPQSDIDNFREDKKDNNVNISEAEYYNDSGIPEWFQPSIKKKGRRYIIKQNRKSFSGEVIIDDNNYTVYIKISYS